MNQSVFDRTSNEDLLEYLKQCNKFRPIDIERSYRIAISSIKYYKGDQSVRDLLVENHDLENRWYKSLENGTPDYSVYNDDYFISDVWACWVIYSRKYLLALQSPKSLHSGISIVEMMTPYLSSIVDLGCGFGYTTKGLKELFPKANVYGTNIEDTFQFKMASLDKNINIVSKIQDVKHQTDLVFASEYFEHFEKPIDHLIEVINHGKPIFLILANAFGSRSVGHFNYYYHNGEKIENSSIGRLFNKTLRDHGYQQVKTKLWNNRPAFWAKAKI